MLSGGNSLLPLFFIENQSDYAETNRDVRRALENNDAHYGEAGVGEAGVRVGPRYLFPLHNPSWTRPSGYVIFPVPSKFPSLT